jgi:hypothetical protein
MRTGILENDLYSEYYQKWYDDSDLKMGFGLTPEQLARLERKYELWKRLHPDLNGPGNRCQICRERSGKTVMGGGCPRYLLVNKDGRFCVVSQEEKMATVRSRGFIKAFKSMPCMEWVKYV